MIKKHKRLFCTLLIVALVTVYVLCFTIPYFQTFGQGYTYKNNFYADYNISVGVGEYPDMCLTYDGCVLAKQLNEKGNRTANCISRVICRVPLTSSNFDQLFCDGFWTHRNIDAEWLRQNCDSAWLGLSLKYGKLSWQYILKLNNGDVVICYGAPLFTEKDPFRLSLAEYFSPNGTVQDFYDHLSD